MVEIVESTPEYMKLDISGMIQIVYIGGTYWCDNPPHWPDGAVGKWEFRADGCMWWNLPWQTPEPDRWYKWKESLINPDEGIEDSITTEEMIKNWLLELSLFKKD